jgi:hypothetical protein
MFLFFRLRLGFKEHEPPICLPVIVESLVFRLLRPTAIRLLDQFMNLGVEMVKQAVAVGLVPFLKFLIKNPGDMVWH